MYENRTSLQRETRRLIIVNHLFPLPARPASSPPFIFSVVHTSNQPGGRPTKISDGPVPTSLQFLISAMVVFATINTMWASVGGLEDMFDAVGWDSRSAGFAVSGSSDADSTLGPSSHGAGGSSVSAASVIGAPRVADAVTRSDVKRWVGSPRAFGSDSRTPPPLPRCILVPFNHVVGSFLWLIDSSSAWNDERTEPLHDVGRLVGREGGTCQAFAVRRYCRRSQAETPP